MNKIGIMQGRLSPSASAGLQSFPWTSWEREFEFARQCNFDLIEWLFETDHYENNPLWTDTGLGKIRDQIIKTGVQVRTCCAQYFMDHPFFRVTEQERLQSITMLIRLILQAAQIGIKTILIPVLESSEIRYEAEKYQLAEALQEPLTLALTQGLRLSLETELPALSYRALIELIGHPMLGIYYDTGNLTSKGYDSAADARILGPYLFGVHIKDRKKGGPNVLLGQGDVNFDGFFQALKETGYTGPVILETFPGQNPVETANVHLKFIKERLA